MTRPFDYIVNNIFMPPELPQEDDQGGQNDHALCDFVAQVGLEFKKQLDETLKAQWGPLGKMLGTLVALTEENGFNSMDLKHAFKTMEDGDVLALLIKAQNAGIVLRKAGHEVVLESFEVSPSAAEVMKGDGKLLCSYPGPAVALPVIKFNDEYFLDELSSFLFYMNRDIMDAAAAHTRKAGSSIVEERDSADPIFITQLLTGIFRGMGSGNPEDVPRICKKIGDDVLWDNAKLPWRRSQIWLVIRVALQMTLFRSSGDHTMYKSFMAFLHAKALQKALDHETNGYLLFAMRAKTCRRAAKVGEDLLPFVSRQVLDVAGRVETVLQQRWKKEIDAHSQSSHWDPSSLDPWKDTGLPLTHSRPYIQQALNRDRKIVPPASFKPKAFKRLRDLGGFDKFTASNLDRFFTEEPLVALIDFEMAVRNELDDWASGNLNSVTSAQTLFVCMSRYHEHADKRYKDSPEEFSIMILTLVHLWVALDQLAVAQCPLMKNYLPIFATIFLEPLLLRKAEDLRRVASISRYISSREDEATYQENVFTYPPSSTSFYARYFRDSTNLRALKARIDTHATSRKAEKQRELDRLNRRHQDLTGRASRLEHDHPMRISRKGNVWYDKRRCQKCQLEKEASKLTIDIYEWPLPSNDTLAAAVVFELDPPKFFSVWREATYFLLHDIFTPKMAWQSSGHANETLPAYRSNFGLAAARSVQGQIRITLGSISSKSWNRSHYRSQSIPSTSSEVCLSNGVQWELYDSRRQTPMRSPFLNANVADRCTLKIPSGEHQYNSLQYSMDTSSDRQNNALTRQSQCPPDLSLHEFISFTHLRIGDKLSWLGLARNFASRELTFGREEVHVLLAQSVMQLGSIERDGTLTNHLDLSSPVFCNTILSCMDDLLSSVEENWREVITVGSVALVASRILASCPDAVARRCYRILARARSTTLRWLRAMMEQFEHFEGNETGPLCQRIYEIALTCRLTFDVDPIDLAENFRHGMDTIEAFIYCSLVINDMRLTGAKTPSHIFETREDRMAIASVEHLWNALGNLEPVGSAIRLLWSSFRNPNHEWTRLSAPREQWLVCKHWSGSTDDSIQTVHYNMRNGELFVDGKPLSLLPTEISSHTLYNRLFGKKTLKVVPTNIHSSEFATRTTPNGYQYFFSMSARGDLVIRAKSETADGAETVRELLPDSVFLHDLPRSSALSHFHWLDLSDLTVEFCPSESPTTFSNNHWKLHFSPHSVSELRIGDDLLVEPRSPTASMIQNMLSGLDSSPFMIIRYTPRSGQPGFVRVTLTRYNLSFFVNDSDLESQNYAGMIVDGNQCPQTLIGLSRRLVLRQKSQIDVPVSRSRRIIIPFGNLVAQKRRDHVYVNVHSPDDDPHVRFHVYDLDTDLGRLIASGDCEGHLYRVYLHALTSSYLPDPLTGHTGTESAMIGLQSALSFSFQRLRESEVALLEKISALSSRRSFYPAHLECMQSVRWNEIHFYLQYPGFERATRDILEHARCLDVFRDESSTAIDRLLKRCSNSERRLLHRALVRANVFYPRRLHLEDNPAPRIYQARDIQTTQEFGFCRIAKALEPQFSDSGFAWISSPVNSLQKMVDRWDHAAGPTEDFSLSYRPKIGISSNKISDMWLSVFAVCRSAGSRRKRMVELVFSLCMLAATKPEAFQDVIPYFILFVNDDAFQNLQPPPWSNYSLELGSAPSRDRLRSIVDSCSSDIFSTPSASLDQEEDESDDSYIQRQSSDYRQRQVETSVAAVTSLMNQWPCDAPRMPSDSYHNYQPVSDSIKNLFIHWRHNVDLQTHLERVQSRCDNLAQRGLVAQRQLSIITIQPFYRDDGDSKALRLPNLGDVMSQRRACNTPSVLSVDPARRIPRYPPSTSTQQTLNTDALKTLIDPFVQSTDRLCQRYGSELERSRQLLLESPNQHSHTTESSYRSYDYLQNDFVELSVILRALLETINLSLGPSNPSEVLVSAAGLWPRVSWATVFELMSYRYRSVLPFTWRQSLAKISTMFLRYQRASTLYSLSTRRMSSELAKELHSILPEVSLSEKYFDWVLVQIDSNFRARNIQCLVAEEMISPSSGASTVLQLNMGEGKTSVIIPMAAATMADSKTLVRVVALKSLSSQMFQLLRERLSDLAGRRIFYFPFSRQVKIGPSQVEQMRKLFQLCIDVGGVLVSQPEHILSLTLMSIDRLLDSAGSKDQFSELQQFISQRARDIFDESDEILHPRYALVYTRGEQTSLEGHPTRWLVTQQLFTLAQIAITKLSQHYPEQVLVQSRYQGSFPLVSILPGERDIGEELKNMLARDIYEGKLVDVHFRHLSLGEHRNVIKFISEKHADDDLKASVRSYFEDDSAWPSVLILRGLLACGILVYCLKDRRWRVDYGLDPERCPLAVPYRAKDVPALRSEFGHPDVAIALTCLAYYYDGLTLEQLATCFDALVKLDNPALEYSEWIQGIDVPRALRDVGGINTDDARQREEELYPRFRHARSVINFYLSRFVFPKAAKQFPHKLPSSGWDLAGDGSQLKTGFSGTNDNRYLLPAPVVQRDPLNQDSTNAFVLQCLLQRENNNYRRIEGVGVTAFLEFLTQVSPSTTVILDVGAQMLDQQNKELAQSWLKVHPSADAAVYFNEDDELTVYTRERVTEPFVSSPYKDQLAKCLVYLDDSHTRGTDLKLPKFAKAAVTLGKKVTKDRLVQGCMRMRQLGNGQSVTFFAPLDVDAAIRKEAGKSNSNALEVIDILRWCMRATIADIEHHVPHWANQGVDYIQRRNAMKRFSDGSAAIASVRSAWVQKEAKPLEEMYYELVAPPRTDMPQFSEIHNRLVDLGVRQVGGVEMDEEQEREVDHEVERERDVERPRHATPAKHQPDPALRTVISQGVIPVLSGLLPLFEVAKDIRYAKSGMNVQKWSSHLLATRDFADTIQSARGTDGSEFLKPVNWVLSVKPKGQRTYITMIVLSQYDVNSFLPSIRTSNFVHLHVFSPRVTGEMTRTFDDLSFYTIPPTPEPLPFDSLVLSQLRLLAGQLYFPSYESYVELCNFLGIARDLVEGVTLQSDGFVPLKYRRMFAEIQASCPFRLSPVPFLKELLSLRRKGNSFQQTPMGKLLSGRPLRREDFGQEDTSNREHHETVASMN